MGKNQGFEPPEASGGSQAAQKNSGEGVPQDPQAEYMLAMLESREEELLAQRRYLPVVLGDEHDNKRAGAPVLGVGVLLVEGGFAFYFLHYVMMVPLWFSVGVTAGVLSGLSLGLKRILDSQYLKAQDASTAVRHILHDDKEQMKGINKR
jgi:hypothetical protein